MCFVLLHLLQAHVEVLWMPLKLEEVDVYVSGP